MYDERSATFFVSTIGGLEDELVSEISELADDLNVTLSEPPMRASAGVYVRAPWTFAIAMNYGLRIASRVLCEVVRAEVRSLDDVYSVVERLNWPSFFSPDKTFVVTSTATDNPIKSPALTLKIKDALVDSFRRHTRERPSVDKNAPEVRVMARLHRNEFSLSLDTTGLPLSQRGYRVAGGDAPLSELLAAGLLRMTGWSQVCRAVRSEPQERAFLERVNDASNSATSAKPSSAESQRRIPARVPLAPELVDPMCGTGTFAIEAALQLVNRRPQTERKFFAFSLLNIFPEVALRQSDSIRRQLRSHELSLFDAIERLTRYRSAVLNRETNDRRFEPPIRGRDQDPSAIFAAQRNAEAAGVGKLIHFSGAEITQLSCPAPEGVMVMNPPYGVRLGDPDELPALYKSIGDTMKKNFKGWQAWVLAGDETLAGRLGLRATRRKKVFNGGLECLWLQYVLF